MENWVTHRLSEITSKIGSGATPLGGEAAYKKSGVSLVRSLNVYDDGFRKKDLAFLDDSQAARLANVVVASNDVLLNITGASIARCCVVPDDALPARVNQHVAIVRPDCNRVLPRFLHYLLISPIYKRRLLSAGEDAGSTRQALTKSLLDGFSILLPRLLSEQHRISAILDKAFASIAAARINAEKNLQNAREIFHRQLQAIFSNASPTWIKSSLASICDVRHGFAFDGKEFSSRVPADRPIVVTPGNFTEDGRLSFTEGNTKRFSGKAPDQFLFEPGDLVVVMTDLSSKMKILGKPAFVEAGAGVILHNQRIGRFVFLNEDIERRFLYYFMLSEPFLRVIRATATGTMVKHTAPKRILGAVIPFPRDHGEQLKIVRELDELRAETQRLESIYQRKLDALDELKQSLLYEGFAGRL